MQLPLVHPSLKTLRSASQDVNSLKTYFWKILWCWEGLGAGGEGNNRGWDGWMASRTRWMWVWVNSGRWWWTGRPGLLRFMGSQRVGHDWATELNWTKLKPCTPNRTVNWGHSRAAPESISPTPMLSHSQCSLTEGFSYYTFFLKTHLFNKKTMFTFEFFFLGLNKLSSVSGKVADIRKKREKKLKKSKKLASW